MWTWGITARIVFACTFWMCILIILSTMNQWGLYFFLDGRRCVSKAWTPLKPAQKANQSRAQGWQSLGLQGSGLWSILVRSYGNVAFECPFEVERQFIVICEKWLDMIQWCADGSQQSDMLDTWHCSYMVQKAQYVYCICVIC